MHYFLLCICVMMDYMTSRFLHMRVCSGPSIYIGFSLHGDNRLFTMIQKSNTAHGKTVFISHCRMIKVLLFLPAVVRLMVCYTIAYNFVFIPQLVDHKVEV